MQMIPRLGAEVIPPRDGAAINWDEKGHEKENGRKSGVQLEMMILRGLTYKWSCPISSWMCVSAVEERGLDCM